MTSQKKIGVWPTTDDGKRVITQSMVSSFVNCPREVYYSSVLGLRTRLTSMPLTRGTWLHALLEERANGGDWRAKHRELAEESRLNQFDEEAEDLAIQCYDIMSSYAWLYKNDGLEPIKAELTVERPMFRGEALYRGRIDLIVRDAEGDIWLMDHKTHRVLPDWRYRELAFQNYSYLWACEKAPQYLELGIPQPKGFIYDYCRTSAIKRPTLLKSGNLSRAFHTDQTTYPVFRQALLDLGLATIVRGRFLLAVRDSTEREYIKKFMLELKTQDYTKLFRRDVMQFDTDQSRRQIKSFTQSAKRLLQYDWSDPDKVERNLTACSGFMCSFKDLTVSDLMHGDSTLEQKTRYVRTHDPLDYYPNQKKGGEAK